MERCILLFYTSHNIFPGPPKIVCKYMTGHKYLPIDDKEGLVTTFYPLMVVGVINHPRKDWYERFIHRW